MAIRRVQTERMRRWVSERLRRGGGVVGERERRRWGRREVMRRKGRVRSSQKV